MIHLVWGSGRGRCSNGFNRSSGRFQEKSIGIRPPMEGVPGRSIHSFSPMIRRTSSRKSGEWFHEAISSIASSGIELPPAGSQPLRKSTDLRPIPASPCPCQCGLRSLAFFLEGAVLTSTFVVACAGGSGQQQGREGCQGNAGKCLPARGMFLDWIHFWVGFSLFSWEEPVVVFADHGSKFIDLSKATKAPRVTALSTQEFLIQAGIEIESSSHRFLELSRTILIGISRRHQANFARFFSNRERVRLIFDPRGAAFSR